jgi:hypothetical protein
MMMIHETISEITSPRMSGQKALGFIHSISQYGTIQAIFDNDCVWHYLSN